MKNNEITFVIQGPIVHGQDINKYGDTAISIMKIKRSFPGAQIIVSTWQGQKTENIDCDLIIENEDPGPTVINFDKAGNSGCVNINRQIVCTLSGLRNVKTKYAVKLRSDNALSNDNIKRLFDKFNTRAASHCYLNSRVITSNLYFFDYPKGISAPFCASDFFHFGETRDLLSLWDIKLFPNYQYRSELAGKHQHESYPWPQPRVEQVLFTSFLKKFIDIEFKHANQNDAGQELLSQKIIANNLAIFEPDQLGLELPSRHKLGAEDSDLSTHSSVRWYSHKRWLYLYKVHCDNNYTFIGETYFAWKYILARQLAFISKGLKQRMRLLSCKLKQ